jgi:hypothetical protein
MGRWRERGRGRGRGRVRGEGVAEGDGEGDGKGGGTAMFSLSQLAKRCHSAKSKYQMLSHAS